MVMFLAITACLALLSVDFASAFTQLEKGTFLIEDDYSEQHHDGKAKPDDKNIRKDHPWDHLVLTQQWPPTACLNSGHHKCVIPSNVHTWTLHGLWPSEGASHSPNFCNNTWHFRESVIEDLETQMDIFWPNLFADQSHTSLWKHEWTKHGTCAAASPILRGEHNYFQSSLNLRQKYPIAEILSNRNIYPSSARAYNVSSMFAAFHQFSGLGETKVSLYCSFSSRHEKRKTRGEENEVFASKTKRQYLYQVEICLNRQLDPIDCLSPGSCSLDRPIYYPPLKRRHFSFLNLSSRSPYLVL